ncbi:DUF1465 family protein [Alteraurantiacibacter aquimixticola]|uniref:DUF1465 family protein n=1 Tax=Alteraurantiacibacter aquimixticola TaxID=2489173 RepID=A0A4T3F275_9SPHN|nr:DUF1465 family protein [Alteraurantiacibacter aquimixticola]TIX51198.1 DUF1465 family protein [Alteraurantiacibacter aquimixticola]
MATPASISPTIVETLYHDAIDLAEEARSVFDLSGRLDAVSANAGLSRVALSCEALRTTTRMMHAIAWLLNHRAYFAGELSEFQLRRHGRLPPAQPESDPEQLAMLDREVRELIGRTRAFYARIARLDNAWRESYTMHPSAIHRLRERLGNAVSGL